MRVLSKQTRISVQFHSRFIYRFKVRMNVILFFIFHIIPSIHFMNHHNSFYSYSFLSLSSSSTCFIPITSIQPYPLKSLSLTTSQVCLFRQLPFTPTPFSQSLAITSPLTLPLSMRLVIMTMTVEFCSQSIVQKSANVAGRGP